jgi:hypothetical protein
MAWMKKKKERVKKEDKENGGKVSERERDIQARR